MAAGITGILLLTLGWCGFFRVARELAARGWLEDDWRLCWIFACVGWAALLTLVVEVVSLFHGLDALMLLVVWSVTNCIVFFCAARLARARGAAGVLRPLRLAALLTSLRGWPTDARVMLAVTAIATGLLGAIALLTPTTNADSFSYHLPRVLHWIQRGSIAHFPTGDTRQVEFGPWAAFVQAHLFLFSGSDRFSNLPQWFAMVTTVIGSTWIAERLVLLSRASIEKTAVQRAQALTALMVVTLPIGMVESITTQTDYVVTAWVIASLVLAISWLQQPASAWIAGGLGLALGLGVLSKATMFVYSAPLVLGMGLWQLRRSTLQWRQWRLAILVTAAFALVTLAHFLRNQAVFGSPLGSGHIFKIEVNAEVSISTTLSNVIRNLALHTDTGIPTLTEALNYYLEWAHRLTGRDLNDPATSYGIGRFTFASQYLVYDSDASCPWHLMLVATAALLFLSRSSLRSLGLGFYVLIPVIAFVLFCALLRWTQWHSRLHLALLAMLMPWVAVLCVTGLPRWIAWVAGAALCLAAGVCLVHNTSRPVLSAEFWAKPRERQYGAVSYQQLLLAVEDLVGARCSRLGLKLHFYSNEYLIRVLLDNRGFAGRLDHCYVDNQTARIPDDAPPPEAVIVTYKTALPSSMVRRFPYVLDYNGVKVMWSENASHWARLTLLSNGQKRDVHHREIELRLERRPARFQLRSPRTGKLHLKANVLPPLGSLRWSTTAEEQSKSLSNGQPWDVILDTPAGTTEILVHNDEASTILMRDFRWNWQPTN